MISDTSLSEIRFEHRGTWLLLRDGGTFYFSTRYRPDIVVGSRFWVDGARWEVTHIREEHFEGSKLV